MNARLLTSLACVIVHYGDPETTRVCLTSLLAAEACPRLVVVCNTDAQGCGELQTLLNPLADGLPPDTLVYIGMGRNAGFAAACNAGMRRARLWPDVSFIWLLNNDTFIAPDAARQLLCCLESAPRAIWGTAVYRAAEPERLELALGCRFLPLFTVVRPCHAGALQENVDSTPQVDYVYGASMAFPLTLLDEVGFLDERFFLYYEEHDFCRRAGLAGYSFCWCRDARVWHGAPVQHAPSGMKAFKGMRMHKQYHENRSTALFMRKHYPCLAPFALFFRLVAKVFLLPWRGEAFLLPSCLKGLLMRNY